MTIAVSKVASANLLECTYYNKTTSSFEKDGASLLFNSTKKVGQNWEFYCCYNHLTPLAVQTLGNQEQALSILSDLTYITMTIDGSLLSSNLLAAVLLLAVMLLQALF
jgi:hypothetical protein